MSVGCEAVTKPSPSEHAGAALARLWPFSGGCAVADKRSGTPWGVCGGGRLPAGGSALRRAKNFVRESMAASNLGCMVIVPLTLYVTEQPQQHIRCNSSRIHILSILYANRPVLILRFCSPVSTQLRTVPLEPSAGRFARRLAQSK